MRFFIILLFSTLAIASFGKPVQISDQDVDGEADDSEYEYAEEETALHSNKKEISRNPAESEYNDLKGSQKIDSRRQETNEDPTFNIDGKDREEKSLDPTENDNESQNLPDEQAHNDRADVDLNSYVMSTLKSDVDSEKRNYITKRKMKSDHQDYLFDKGYANEDVERRPNRDTNRNYQKRQPQRYNNYESINSQRSRNPQRYARGRREVEPPNQDTNLNENGKLDDEEAAIRRHVKKLSKDELEEFLNSLTDDKRLLLKKIMDNSEEDSIMKREITKKEGAALDMNGFNDNGQAEMKSLNIASNSEGSLTSTVAPSSAVAEAKDAKSETPNIVTTKVDTENTEKSGMSNNDKTGISIELESNLQPGVPQVTTKVDIKRETRDDDQEDAEAPRSEPDSEDRSLDKQPEADNLENLDNLDVTDETDNSDAELEDSIKSLEESFPNPISYGDSSWSESDMNSHLRVKRTDADNTENTYTKCEHIPYRAENEDEDSDEGSEFDDDGFYDRTSNIAKNVNERIDSKISKEEENANVKLQSTNSENEAPKFEKDNSLGSDSDSVLSGEEGVNDNIMLTRERRSDDEDTEDRADSLEGNLRSNGLKDKSRNNYAGVPNYQENDAFGPLPKNYESESGRYKRVRLAKSTQLNKD